MFAAAVASGRYGTATPPLAVAIGQYEQLTGTCQNSQAMSGEETVSSVAACQQLCDDDSRCVAVDTDGSSCYLKSQCEGDAGSCSGWCAYRQVDDVCGASPIDGLDCKDDDLDGGHKSGVGSAAECCSLCSSFDGCTTWTYYDSRQDCYLKTGCNTPVSKDSVSGGAVAPVPSPSPSPSPSPGRWETIDTSGVTPHGKDEAGYYEWEGALCMIGGRGNQPVDCYHPATTTWTRAGTTTDDLHHLQPVIWQQEVWIVAAWHGGWPNNEKNIESVVIYNPKQDTLRTGASIPSKFGRGGAGCVLYDDLIYVVQGASNGHLAQYGAAAYQGMSTFNPATGEWKALASVPQYNRDHFDAVLIGTKLVIASGRDTPRGCTSSGGDINCNGKPNIFHYTVGPAEIYDFAGDGQWHAVASLPTQRAGAMVLVDQLGRLVVLGGESDTQSKAFSSVEAYDLGNNTWTKLPGMNTGRHTGGAELYESGGKFSLIAASGVGQMGGSPQLTDTEQWVQV